MMEKVVWFHLYEISVPRASLSSSVVYLPGYYICDIWNDVQSRVRSSLEKNPIMWMITKLDLPGYDTAISIEDEVGAEQKVAIVTHVSFLTLHFLDSVDENIYFVFLRNEGDHGNYLA